MAWLVQTERAAAGQRECGEQAPAFVADRLGELDALVLELGDRRVDVVAHEVQLVLAVPVDRVHGKLGRRQGKDQPAVTGIHGRPSQDFTEELARLLGTVAVDNRVYAGDHLRPSSSVNVATQPR